MTQMQTSVSEYDALIQEAHDKIIAKLRQQFGIGLRLFGERVDLADPRQLVLAAHALGEYEGRMRVRQEYALSEELSAYRGAFRTV